MRTGKKYRIQAVFRQRLICLNDVKGVSGALRRI